MYTRPSTGTADGMEKLALNELPDIPACQPADFDFPKGTFEKTCVPAKLLGSSSLRFFTMMKQSDITELCCHHSNEYVTAM